MHVGPVTRFKLLHVCWPGFSLDAMSYYFLSVYTQTHAGSVTRPSFSLDAVSCSYSLTRELCSFFISVFYLMDCHARVG
jgi:hypothetical protein